MEWVATASGKSTNSTATRIVPIDGTAQAGSGNPAVWWGEGVPYGRHTDEPSATVLIRPGPLVCP